MAADAPEHVLCDTSFIAISERSERRPAVVDHWPSDAVARVEAAVLAISVISLGEIRAGRIASDWGEARCDRQEERLASLIWIPLDTEIVDCWAELYADSLVSGWAIRDNDLWIAATAVAKDLTLVACDRGFRHVPGLDLLYLPVDTSSRPLN